MVKGEGEGGQFTSYRVRRDNLIYIRTDEEIRNYVWVHTWRDVWRLGCLEPWADACRQINEAEQPW